MADFTLNAQHQEAMRLVRAGDYIEAMALCRQILHVFPKHIGTYLVLGQMYLQLGEHAEAANLFRRVLSADPECALCYASMGVIYDERGLLEEAIWQLERAVELSPANGEIRRELRRLYAEQQSADGVEVKMTRGALARAYLRGQLYPKAIGELRVLLRDAPYRYDLRVALVQTLWLDERHHEAEVVSQGILADLPNCLKANLILGRLWLDTDREEEARSLLQRAQVLDPDNIVAQQLFGDQSPLPPRVARLPAPVNRSAPWDLPYLLLDEDEEIEEEPVLHTLDMIVGEAAEAEPAPEAQEPEPPHEAEAAPEAGPAAPSGSGPTSDWRGNGHGEAQVSLLARYEQQLEDDPEDYVTRLALARRLRDIGAVDRALAEYDILIAQYPETWHDVALDLQLMNRLQPGERDLVALLITLDEKGVALQC
jgi:tetratricopeptide (TPR) repeat protein